jgi:hypothetical protein
MLTLEDVASFVLAHGLEGRALQFAFQLGRDAEDVDGGGEDDDAGQASQENGRDCHCWYCCFKFFVRVDVRLRSAMDE